MKKQKDETKKVSKAEKDRQKEIEREITWEVRNGKANAPIR